MTTKASLNWTQKPRIFDTKWHKPSFKTLYGYTCGKEKETALWPWTGNRGHSGPWPELLVLLSTAGTSNTSLSHRHQVCAWYKKNIFGGQEHIVSMDKQSNNTSERIMSKTFTHPHGSCPITLSLVYRLNNKEDHLPEDGLNSHHFKSPFRILHLEHASGAWASHVGKWCPFLHWSFITQASLTRWTHSELNYQWRNFSKQNPLLAVPQRWVNSATPTSIHCFSLTLPKDWQRFYSEVLSVEDITLDNTSNHTICWWAHDSCGEVKKART